MAVTIKTEQIRNTAVTPAKIDLTQTFSFASGVLRAATPAGDSDVATKQYVDGLISGLHWKDSVRAATTANITLSGTQTIDGVSLSADQRILVKDQTDATENGIYVVASGSWSRASDMDEGAEFPSAAVFVREGTVNADLGFVCTNDSDPTLGTDNINFTQFNGAANITAGDGLDKTGNTLSVNVDDSSLEISGDNLQVKSGGITNDMLAGSIANAKLSNSTISGVALGGTLNTLSAASTGGITLTSYDGSAAVTDLAINLDGATLATSASGLKVAASGINTLQLANDAVTTDKIASSGVETDNVKDAAITAGKIAGDAIDASKIADAAVQREHLNSNVVNSDGALGLDPTNNDLLVITDDSTIEVNVSNQLALVDGGVSTAKLADASVSTAKLAADAVDQSKIADAAVQREHLNSNVVNSAGAIGLDPTNNDLLVITDDSTIEVNGENSLAIKAGSVDGGLLKFAPRYISLSGMNGTKTAFDLTLAIDSELVSGTIVYLNGIAIEKVASSPSTDQYTVSADGGTGGVGLVTFGTAPSSSDTVTVLFFG